MLDLPNSTTRSPVFVGAGLAWPDAGRALPGRPPGRLGKITTAAVANLKLGQLPPKLDFRPNPAKSTTSKFLIENLNGFSGKPFTLSAVEESRPPRHLAAEACPASSSEPPASRKSNRHIPELESGLSYRKQRIGPLSNRHKFTFFNFAVFAFPGPSSRTSNIEPPTSRILIENDMRSREMPSGCKHSTYEFLIANEFHSRFAPKIAPRDRQHERHSKLRYNGEVEFKCIPKGDLR